jgi:hypothetical protein
MRMRRVWRWYVNGMVILCVLLATIANLSAPVLIGWVLYQLVSPAAGFVTGVLLALLLWPLGVYTISTTPRFLGRAEP